MPTSPVTATVSGTTFSVNVTPANLDTVLSIRDFIILENGTLTVNPLSYTKTTPTSITYAGPVLDVNTTLEIRRNTPRTQRVTVLPNTKVRAVDWNQEFDRRVRIQEEVDLYGAGGGITVRLPLNDAYGVAWSTDTVFGPTRKALYDQMETYVSANSPTFTGIPTAPTPAINTNTAQLATTAYVQSNLGGLAPLVSPAFTGNPTANTQLTTDSSTRLATTAYVKGQLYAPLASPTFTGVPIVPTPANGVKTAQVVNALTLQKSSQPIVIAKRTAALPLTTNTFTDVVYDSVVSDTMSTYNSTTGVFTAPYTGVYEFRALGTASLSTALVLMVCQTTGVEITRISHSFVNTATTIGTNGSTLDTLNAGDTRKINVFSSGATTALLADPGPARSFNHMSINYLGIATAS